MNSSKRRVNDGYELSRKMYIVEALFEYLISILSSGAYLAKLTTTVGISDSMTAMLSAITSLSSLFQIVSIYLAHKTPVKRWVVPLQFFTTLLFASLYLIPLLGIRKNIALIFFIVMVSANALKSITSPIKINWFLSLVPSHERGMYRSKLTIVSVIFGTLFTLGASSVIDSFEKKGDLNGAFATLTAALLVLVVLHIIPLILSKEKHEIVEKRESPFCSVRSLFSNRYYRGALIVFTIHSVASSVTMPYLSTYQINELGFSMTFIAAMDVALNLIWIAALFLLGKLSLKKSNASMLSLAYIFSFLAFTALVFTGSSFSTIAFFTYRVMFLGYNASICVAEQSFIFECTPPEERTSAIAIFTIFTGVTGFICTLAVTPLFNYVQANGFTLFGYSLYAQQLLAIVSALIILFVNIAWWAFCHSIKGNLEFSDV